mgnify:CR=1 FL=1
MRDQEQETGGRRTRHGGEQVDANRDRQTKRRQQQAPGPAQNDEQRIPRWMRDSQDVGGGDVFAGAMAAYLLSEGTDGLPELEQMRVALEHANRTASFNVESFGTTSITELSDDAYQQRP